MSEPRRAASQSAALHTMHLSQGRRTVDRDDCDRSEINIRFHSIRSRTDGLCFRSMQGPWSESLDVVLSLLSTLTEARAHQEAGPADDPEQSDGQSLLCPGACHSEDALAAVSDSPKSQRSATNSRELRDCTRMVLRDGRSGLFA